MNRTNFNYFQDQIVLTVDDKLLKMCYVKTLKFRMKKNLK